MPTVHDKVTRIIAVKAAIKNAIEAKGPTVGSIPFDEYAGKIAEIADLSAAQTAVEAVNGETSVDLNTAIALTSSTKLAIETAIETAGVDVPALTPFADYADYVAQAVREAYFSFDIPTKTLTGYGYNMERGGTDIIIPETLQNVPVEHIGRDFCYRNSGYRKEATSLLISANIKTIGWNAFKNNILSNQGSVGPLVIPNTVTTIEEEAFRSTSCGNITLPTNAGYTLISVLCFYDCNMTTVVVPSPVTNIDSNAFLANPITKFVFPANLTITNSTALGVYGADLFSLYNGNGKLAGVYEYAAGSWSKTA